MLRVAITGGIGSGKSTVAAMFAQRGAHVVSSDEVARTLMQPGEAVYEKIVDRFGHSVVLQDGHLDRRRLAQIAFADGRVKELESIVHPAVIGWQSEWFRRMETNDPNGVAMVESALVFESQFVTVAEKRFDRIILVITDEATRVERIIRRALAQNPETNHDALRDDARRRLALQMPDEDKRKLVDFTIENNGGLKDVEEEVDSVWNALATQARFNASNQKKDRDGELE